MHEEKPRPRKGQNTTYNNKRRTLKKNNYNQHKDEKNDEVARVIQFQANYYIKYNATKKLENILIHFYVALKHLQKFFNYFFMLTQFVEVFNQSLINFIPFVSKAFL